MSKSASLVRVTIAYAAAVAAGAAWLLWGPATDHVWLDGLVADLIATVVIFGFSRFHRNSSFYDAYWSVIPPLLVAWWWYAARDAGDNSGDTKRLILLACVVGFWAVRLTGNWVYNWPGLHHEDWRYSMLRDGAGRAEFVVDLMAIHVIPTLQVFAGLIPAYVVATSAPRDLGWLDLVAVIVGVGAVVIEWTADVQMLRFIRGAEPGQVMDRGLWGWSRHPNYFGEISFWLSLALFGLAADPGSWWVLMGTVAMVAMFLGASIPMMERRSLERRPAYQGVIDRVSMLVPWPPSRSR